jgi:catechol 2,3-dioxygenase
MYGRLRPQVLFDEDSGLSVGTEAPAIDPATTMGVVRLTVSDLDRARSFYERTLGLKAQGHHDSTVVLGDPQRLPVVELHGDPASRPLDRGATGLFHLAILVPTRLELARSLWRLAVHRWPLDGASDHLVSEALYLSDPDGNGIEIYRDRPRDEWPRANGQLRMATLPLDLDHVLGELNAFGADESDAPVVPDDVAVGTRIGHVHLQVSDLREAEEFYRGVLGFEVTVRGYPGALFVSAGGYHHHIGLNTWHSAGAKPPPSDSIGLRDFEVVLPEERALEHVLGRVRAAGLAADGVRGGARVRDPSGNAVVLRVG